MKISRWAVVFSLCAWTAGASADPVVLELAGTVLSVYEYDLRTGERSPRHEQEFAPAFEGAGTVSGFVAYETDLPDTDVDAHAGAYAPGTFSIFIPEIGLVATRSGSSVGLYTYDDAPDRFVSLGDDQFIVDAQGVDDFANQGGLSGPVSFFLLLYGNSDMLVSDGLPGGPLDWTEGHLRFDFIASDGTDREVVVLIQRGSAPNLWQQVHAFESPIEDVAIAATGDLLVGSFYDGVLRSTDGGSTWEASAGLSNPQVQVLTVDASGRILVGTQGRIHISSDNGANWVPFSASPFNTWAIAVNAGGHVFAGTWGGGAFHSTDGGQNWAPVHTSLASQFVHAFLIDGTGRVIAGTPDGVFRSTVDGQTWLATNTGLTDRDVRALAADSGGHLFAGTADGMVFRSTDGGEHWREVSSGHGTVMSIVVDARDFVYQAVWGGGVLRSVDDGASWNAINDGLTDLYVKALALSRAGQLYAGTDSRLLFRTLDVPPPPPPCGLEIAVGSIECNGIDAQGHPQFAVTLRLTSPQGLGFAGFRAEEGDILPSEPMFVSGGSSTHTFTFVDRPPFDSSLTIRATFRLADAEESCWTTVDVDLPACSGVETPHAQPRSMGVSDAHARPGATGVPVSIEVDDATGIAGGDLTLSYDAAALTATEVQSSSLLSDAGLAFVANLGTPGQVRVSFAGATAIALGSGALVLAYFEVHEGAQAGTYDLALTRADLRDGSAQLMEMSEVSYGQFTVEPRPSLGPLTIRVSDAAATPGATGVEVNIEVDEATGIAGGDLTLTYDAGALTATQVRSESLLDGVGITLVSNLRTPGQVRVSFAGATGIPSGGGPLMKVSFDVKAGAQVGTYDLALTREDLRDGSAQLMALSAVSHGRFTVQSSPSAGLVSIDFDLAQGDQGRSTQGGVAAGRTYTVQLHAVNAPPINGWSARIEFDPLQVRYVSGSFVLSGFVAGMLSLVEEKPAYVSVGGAVLGGGAQGAGPGLLGSATFEVLAGFTGETALTIRQMSWKHVGSGEEILTVQVVGTLSAADGLAGDFNGDGAVNFSDFFLFADAFGGSDPAYDLTGDGQVNFSDFFVLADAFGTEERAKLMALATEYLGLPAAARLEQSYPNPFNSSTIIRYQLGQDGWVRLDIYDLSGQLVRSLADGWQAAGTHAATWDGASDRGAASAAGLYFARLEAGGSTQVSKMLLVK